MTEDRPPTIDPDDVADRLEALPGRMVALQQRLEAAAGNAPQARPVLILPVSKGHPVEAVIAAVDLGWREFGENYAHELSAKAELLSLARPDVDVCWHFIGQLQSNKIRTVANEVGVWQSVDRAKLCREIARRSPGARIHIQVNLSDDPAKAGCTFEEAPELVALATDLGLRVEGLMGVGAADDDEATAVAFRRLRALVDALKLAECSIGMSADLELAVRSGSTLVRIGTALFGPRG